ncbi:MAG: putative dsRNA-binding protein, partial [Cyanobacteriota bacterium]|nr:putative dsRNA-binding protein [Cyanobacteriota bacterium]
LIRPWLDPHFQKGTIEILRDPARQNYKAALQEWTQSHYKVLPEYTVEESGPMGHEERYTAQVWFQGQAVGRGRGRSIKAAEQAAAQEAYTVLVISPEKKHQD